MSAGAYRAEAGRALRVVTAISALVLGMDVIAILAGSQALHRLATTIAHACLRIWAGVPGILQAILGTLVTVGLAAGALWLWSAGKRWLSAAQAFRALRWAPANPPARFIRLLARHALTGRVTLIQTARPLALTAGLMTPHILVSTALVDVLDDNELEAVLLHERSHLRHRDPLSLLFGRVLATVFCYVPAVSALAHRHQAAVELAADDDAIASQGDSFSLSSAMVKLSRWPAARTERSLFTGVADLRLSRLLEREVTLPGVSPRSALLSTTAVAGTLMLVAAVHGLAAAFDQVAFIWRCIV